MLKLASRDPDKDYSTMLYKLLGNYVDKDSDLEPAQKAIQYLLDQLDTREEREELLGMLFQSLGDKNDGLGSELATLLGLTLAETAAPDSAPFYLMQGYQKNRYNKIAFTKLAELMPDEIEPGVHLERLRFAMGENPMDMEAAINFASYAEQLGLYQTASDAYGYVVELFKYLYPTEKLPAMIYLPWAISTYNTQRNQHKCLQIAQSVRQDGRFDLLLESIAAKAAEKIGSAGQAEQMLKAAESQALGRSHSEELAWFYSFVMVDNLKALGWANRAYSAEPNSTMAASLLAYSLVASGQGELAKSLIEGYEQTQISDLAMAGIEMAKDQNDAAIETLKRAIEKDPGSIEGHRARKLLSQLGGDYIGPVDTELVSMSLIASFGKTVVPGFVSPDKMVTVQLNLRGTKFSYGRAFGASLVITNNSTEELVVSDGGLLSGYMRVDAKVSGDVEAFVPNLVTKKVRPSSPIESGKSLIVPLRLATGKLRGMLMRYPQASVDIEFVAYLDPVINAAGEVGNRLVDIEPAKVTVSRPGVKVTNKYLQNRINSISSDRQGQKIKTAQLFVGLLAEQNAMAGGEPMYIFMYADWMSQLLKSVLADNLDDDDWVAKVHIMGAMYELPLDYELIEAVSENLNDDHWPARLMAMVLLAKNQGDNFQKPLDWAAKYDSDQLVRDMAVAFGAAQPEEQRIEGVPEQVPANSNL